MNWLNGFNGRVETDVPLAGLTSFNLGGPARWVVSPATCEALGDVMRRACDHGVDLKALGSGANVLVRDDGFDGVVVRLDEPFFTSVDFDGARVRVGAGADLMQLTFACARRGLAGLEGLAGIPGTIGGAVRMNAGGRYGEIGDIVEEVCLVDRRGFVERLGHDDLGFGYRRSNIGARIIVSATLGLVPSDVETVLERFRSVWVEKKRTQPFGEHSAGCVFKNPKGESAGALIDRSGLKGMSYGGASVSKRHANFMVTDAEARSSDVLRLIDQVREIVQRQCGVQLEPEIDIW